MLFYFFFQLAADFSISPCHVNNLKVHRAPVFEFQVEIVHLDETQIETQSLVRRRGPCW